MPDLFTAVIVGTIIAAVLYFAPVPYAAHAALLVAAAVLVGVAWQSGHDAGYQQRADLELDPDPKEHQ